MSDSVIKIQNIRKRFGNILALDDVTFDVPKNSIFGLLGPNGAGKTTLFSIIANFLKADAGEVECLGVNIERISELQGRVSILPQDAEFQRNIPILEQLVFFRMLDGQDRAVAEREVNESLEMVGLKDYAKRGVRALSHGMVKRVGIAQAFLGQPEVIMLDEPTSGLDPANARQIRDLVRELQAQATIMISSHNLDEIQELCTDVAIMDRGKLVTSTSVAELTRSGRELIIEFSRELTEEERGSLSALPAVSAIRPGGLLANYTFVLDLTQTEESWEDVVTRLLRALLDLGAVPRKLSEGRSLESHFLELTGGVGGQIES